MPVSTHRVVLAQRPKGTPTLEDFRIEDAPLPQLEEDQVLLQTLFLSLDPYMRGRMNEGPSYAPPVALDAVMEGGTVARVLQSRHPKHQEGSLVVSQHGWQSHAVVSGERVQPISPSLKHPSYMLGALGMPGFTAYHGLLRIGAPKPGETVVVSAATGAVGSLVGQLARRFGCRAVGIAGGPDKCKLAVERLGFDACVDHKDPRLPRLLAEACPKGIDVDFENVGGKVLEAILPLLNVGARVPLCGMISQYNLKRLPEGPDKLPTLLRAVLTQRVRLEGFIILDAWRDYPAFLTEVSPWIEDGSLQVLEDLVDGLDNAPQAFLGLLEGKNLGKLVIRVAE